MKGLHMRKYIIENENEEEIDETEIDTKETQDSDVSDTKPKEKKEVTSDETVTKKLKALQDQYQNILVDLFKTLSPDCIVQALNDLTKTSGPLGGNITQIVTTATDLLKAKIYKELGVECPDYDDDTYTPCVGNGGETEDDAMVTMTLPPAPMPGMPPTTKAYSGNYGYNMMMGEKSDKRIKEASAKMVDKTTKLEDLCRDVLSKKSKQ